MLFADFGIENEDGRGTATQAQLVGDTPLHRNGSMGLPLGARYSAVQLSMAPRSPSDQGSATKSDNRLANVPSCPVGSQYDPIEQQCVPLRTRNTMAPAPAPSIPTRVMTAPTPTVAPRYQVSLPAPRRGDPGPQIQPSLQPQLPPNVTTRPVPGGGGASILDPNAPASGLPDNVASELINTGTVGPQPAQTTVTVQAEGGVPSFAQLPTAADITASSKKSTNWWLIGGLAVAAAAVGTGVYFWAKK